MTDAFICDAIRTPFGRYGGALASVRAGEAQLIIAGGSESMTRAPFVMGKADSAFSRAAKIEDTTIGWRFGQGIALIIERE